MKRSAEDLGAAAPPWPCTAASSAAEHPRSAARRVPIEKGSEGWESTGATTGASAIIARANPPVKHMPTTPTPGPPAALVGVARERAEPLDDGARPPRREDA